MFQCSDIITKYMYVLFTVPGIAVGVVMILSSYCFFASVFAFFVFGSKVTKYKVAQKKKIEVDFKEGEC